MARYDLIAKRDRHTGRIVIHLADSRLVDDLRKRDALGRDVIKCPILSKKSAKVLTDGNPVHFLKLEEDT